MTEHRHRSPREVGGSPSLEIFPSCLDVVLGKLLEQRLDQITSRGPCQTQPFWKSVTIFKVQLSLIIINIRNYAVKFMEWNYFQAQIHFIM